MCPTCVDAKGERVENPICWALPRSCAPLQTCEPSQNLLVSTPRGQLGAEPCCDTYKCVTNGGLGDSAAKKEGQTTCPISSTGVPAACPSGSHLGVPPGVDAAGCARPGTCVDDADATKAVAVPECYQSAAVCNPGVCAAPGMRARLKTPRGAQGQRPCCDEYECVPLVGKATSATQGGGATSASSGGSEGGAASGGEEDTSTCGAITCNAPRKCPNGSSLSTPKDDRGCPGCPTCVSALTALPVAVPACYADDFVCQPGVCPNGQRSKLSAPAGADGAAPCCPQYDCLVDPAGSVVMPPPECKVRVEAKQRNEK